MADDRALEEPAEQASRLEQELADLRALVNARMSRRPTGDVESTIRATPKDGTLLCNGQVVARDAYPDLWAWAQEQGLVITGLFTAGDGSTTFGLPNFQGRIPVGAGSLGSDTYALGALSGAATKVLTTANLPAHDHNVAVAAHATHDHNVAVSAHSAHSHGGSAGSGGSHSHGGSVGSAGGHGGHFPGSQVNAVNGSDWGVAAWNSGGSTGGAHTHSITTDTEAAHSHSLSIDSGGPTTHSVNEAAAGPTTHTVTEASVGSGTAVDVRQPSIAIQWLIWT